MRRVLHWLVPREEEFFDMLVKQSQYSLDAAQALEEYVNNYGKLNPSERKSKAQAIKTIESTADDLTHDIIDKLNKTFITPIDKEDIHQMVVVLDDIIDLINAVSLRFNLMNIESTDDFIERLTHTILSAVSAVHACMVDLKKLKYKKEDFIKIHSLENKADEIYHEALSELFHDSKSPLEIIKMKEIYELLEKITDKCEDASNIIENIVVKHA